MKTMDQVAVWKHLNSKDVYHIVIINLNCGMIEKNIYRRERANKIGRFM